MLSTDLDNIGRQPLHEAIDSIDCVAYLVKHDSVDVNALKRGDWTPVMSAGKRFHRDSRDDDIYIY